MLLRALVGLLCLVYPFLILFGLKFFGPQVLSVGLLIALLLRYRLQTQFEFNVLPLVVVPACLLLLGLFGYGEALFYIPFGINVCLLALFYSSLHSPPTIIEKIARNIQPNLPPEAIGYCQNVTKIWCLFFLLNGFAAFFTARFCSPEIWATYNSGLSYVLIAVLLGAEYLYRQRFRRRVMEKHGYKANKVV